MVLDQPEKVKEGSEIIAEPTVAQAENLVQTEEAEPDSYPIASPSLRQQQFLIVSNNTDQSSPPIVHASSEVLMLEKYLDDDIATKTADISPQKEQ